MVQKTLNLVILAHVDAGRTLTEPLLDAAGTSRSAGRDR
jgi:translation elongation factor EF-G